MKMEAQGDTLRVTGITELGAPNANDLRDRIRAALADSQRHIEIDLSATAFVDSCGLGALIALHKTACSRGGSVRLLNPLPPVQQVLELTRLNRVFEISKG
jgi:anti-sigma B factor antagonist